MSKELITTIHHIAENDDPIAFKKLFHCYSQPLLHYAASIVPMPLAEEVVQDVFINLWKNRTMLHAIKNLSYYLHTAVKNIAINYFNQQKRQASFNFDEVGTHHSFSYTTPETDCIGKDSLNEIITAVQNLSPKCQLIFRMAKENNMTYKEIAQLLQIAPKTVENHMNIALKKIAEAAQKAMPQYAAYYKRHQHLK